MELMELPDDALVPVLQFVTEEALLNCRLVCKRLRDLAMHRDVWRHRVIEISYLEYDPLEAIARAALHLAPCLQKVVVDEKDIIAFSKSKCAVADVVLSATVEKGPNIPVHYAEAVRNQEALGRLRRLHLIIDVDYDVNDEDFYDDYNDEDASEELAEAVMACSALVELHIEGNSNGLFPSHDLKMKLKLNNVTQKPARPTLKKLRCDVDVENLPFVSTLLAGHGATLEEVIFYCVGDGRYLDTIPRLLGAMPRLRSVNCHAMSGLQAVAACTMLKKVDLSVREWEPKVVQDATELLRRAKLLHEVHILVKLQPPLGVAEQLIKALASSGSRLIVEHLVIICLSYEEMRELPLTLPSLPALRSLNVSECYRAHTEYKAPSDALDKLLLAITPETAPALRTLELGLTNCRCPHAWVHRAAVSKALAINPSLHILSMSFRAFHCEHCHECTLTHCHEEVYGPWKICLFSHDSRKCTYAHHRDKVWVQMDPNVLSLN